MTMFPKPLTGTYNYYELIRPYQAVLILYALPEGFRHPLFTPTDRFSCSLNEPGYSSCRLYAGYRCSRYTGCLCTFPNVPCDHWFPVSLMLFTTPHRAVHFRSASISTPDRFPIIWAFCLLTLTVQYQPLEKEAPQGGLETFPVKRIRETNLLNSLTILGQSVHSTSADMIKGKLQPLISFKVMMNQFQRTFFLIYRKILIFESALIHRRTHTLLTTTCIVHLAGSALLLLDFIY